MRRAMSRSPGVGPESGPGPKSGQVSALRLGAGQGFGEGEGEGEVRALLGALGVVAFVGGGGGEAEASLLPGVRPMMRCASTPCRCKMHDVLLEGLKVERTMLASVSSTSLLRRDTSSSRC